MAEMKLLTKERKPRHLTTRRTGPWGASPEYLTRVAKFVFLNHPEGPLWTEEVEQLDQTYIAEVYDRRDGEIAGVWWFEYITETWLEMHGCAKPEWHNRWASLRILDEIWEAVALAGPTITEVRTLGIDPKVARICRALGWTEDAESGFWTIKMEPDDGQSKEAEGAEASPDLSDGLGTDDVRRGDPASTSEAPA